MIKKLIPELEAIRDTELKFGAVEILTKFEDVLEWCPSSSTGDYHESDPMLIDHLKRAFRFAYWLSEHEHLPQPNFDIAITAALIHDIGKCAAIQLEHPGEEAISKEPENWAFRQETFWVYRPNWNNHPVTGSLEVMKCGTLPHKEEIATLVYTHHHKWFPNPLEVLSLEGRIVSMADYLSSRKFIRFSKGWRKYG